MSPRRPPPPHANVHLPSLDGDQALSIVNILDRLISAIWRAHGHAMAAALEEEYARRDSLRQNSSKPEPSNPQSSNPPSQPDDFPF